MREVMRMRWHCRLLHTRRRLRWNLQNIRTCYRSDDILAVHNVTGTETQTIVSCHGVRERPSIHLADPSVDHGCNPVIRCTLNERVTKLLEDAVPRWLLCILENGAGEERLALGISNDSLTPMDGDSFQDRSWVTIIHQHSKASNFGWVCRGPIATALRLTWRGWLSDSWGWVRGWGRLGLRRSWGCLVLLRSWGCLGLLRRSWGCLGLLRSRWSWWSWLLDV